METPSRWQLVQLLLNGCTFDQLVEQCALFLKNPLVIIDNTYRIIAHSRSITAPDEVWTNAVKRGYVTLEFAATLNNWAALKDKDSRYERMTVSQITPLRRRFYHISFQGELLGYLNITEGSTVFEDVGTRSVITLWRSCWPRRCMPSTTPATCAGRAITSRCFCSWSPAIS